MLDIPSRMRRQISPNGISSCVCNGYGLLMICPFSGSDYSLRQLKKIIAINWQSTMFIKLWQQAFPIQYLSKSRIATKNPESYVALNTVSLNATLVGTISTASIGTGRSAPISLATSMSPGWSTNLRDAR